MLSSRGLVGTEPLEAAAEQLARHGLSESHPDILVKAAGALTPEAMQSWPAGLEEFYRYTMANSGFSDRPLVSSASDPCPPSVGMQLIGAILVAAQPLSLAALASLIGETWQRVLTILSPVRLLFPLDHTERDEYLDNVDPQLDLDDHEDILGSRAHSQASKSCALSTVSVYHKSVYDW